eukprot:m.177287 g.177287  ORF g.177287 m.177287 type:complete len:1395 (+) comp39158_c2_seq36:44-4228(+)
MERIPAGGKRDSSATKTLKLWIHQTDLPGIQKEEELMINPSDFPDEKVGTVVEIRHSEDESNCLLLQVSAIKSDLKAGQISVSNNVASVFQLKSHREVRVRIVEPVDVTLELVELGLKDQFVSQGDMWRLKNTLVNKCVYVNKKISFFGVRAQIKCLFLRGQKATCGYIGPMTKVIFRSNSCSVYLMIQMSREMWEFDPYGDLYFEKAIQFLEDYFDRWKKNGCSHELTVIFFSRTFYPGALQSDFSPDVCDRIQIDHRGRCYQDFYRVLFQNGNLSDFSSLLVVLKKTFSTYLSHVNCCRQIGDVNSPPGKNSTATEGNFLEMMNLCLNVFERRYMEQQFDWTGEQVVTVTPGVGLFEVDRHLTKTTKLRTTDAGIASDLVCLASQPLHAVPLFKFFKQPTLSNSDSDSFSIPYWINCSFYTSKAEKERQLQGKFIPRVSIPDFTTSSLSCEEEERTSRTASINNDGEDKLNRTDFDDYDAHAFSPISGRHHVKSSPRLYRRRSSEDLLDVHGLGEILGPHFSKLVDHNVQLKEEPPTLSFSDDGMSSRSSSNPPHFHKSFTDSDFMKTLAPSALLHQPLVNPFGPFKAFQKSALSTHRWQHSFLRGPEGRGFQEHRVIQEPESIMEDSQLFEQFSQVKLKVQAAAKMAIKVQKAEQLELGIMSNEEVMSYFNKARLFSQLVVTSKYVIEVIGMDWTSLTSPACLPLTTDYVPPKLLEEYSQTPYTVSADSYKGLEKEGLSVEQVCKELVFQRLCKCFQIVVLKAAKDRPSFFRKRDTDDYYLGTGRQYHRIRLSSPQVQVTVFKPNHAKFLKASAPYQYTYQIWGAVHESYQASNATFHKGLLDDVNWNSLDTSVFGASNIGELGVLVESWKYWRSRYLLLPVYDPASLLDSDTLIRERHFENFIRFLEAVNRVRRLDSTSSKGETRHLSIQFDTKRRWSKRRLKASNTIDVPYDLPDSQPILQTDKQMSTEQDLAFKEQTPEMKELTESSSLDAITKAMKDESCGVDIIDGQSKLKAVKCFLGFDAVSWLLSNVKNVKSRGEAANLGQRLLTGHHFVHASGKLEKDFLDGFFFYTFETAQASDAFGDSWMEVRFEFEDSQPLLSPSAATSSPFRHPLMSLGQTPTSPTPSTPTKLTSVPVAIKSQERYRRMVLNADPQNKGGRHEWMVVKYDSNYGPSHAFSIDFQWLVTTGCLVNDVVHLWSRRASQCGFQLISVPASPMAHAYQATGNPFRGPVFVAFDVGLDCVQKYFTSNRVVSPKLALFTLQEAILRKLGFLHDSPAGFLAQISDSTLDAGYRRVYVHWSGLVFAQIAKPILRGSGKSTGALKLKLGVGEPVEFHKAGFYWTGNTALPRRARSTGTEIDQAEKKVVRELTDLCRNAENRLESLLAN